MVEERILSAWVPGNRVQVACSSARGFFLEPQFRPNDQGGQRGGDHPVEQGTLFNDSLLR